MYAGESTSGASPESTLDTINRGEHTPLRMTGAGPYVPYTRGRQSPSVLGRAAARQRPDNETQEERWFKGRPRGARIGRAPDSILTPSWSVQRDTKKSKKEVKSFRVADNVRHGKQQRGRENKPEHSGETKNESNLLRISPEYVPGLSKASTPLLLFPRAARGKSCLGLIVTATF